jgi:hypothetical protein
MTQSIFPAEAFTESMSEASVKLEGQKVVFDKKVSLLPADIKKQEEPKLKAGNGKSSR